MWFLMLFVALIIPLTMLGFGLLFKYKPRGNINSSFGYRTVMSAKNTDTWLFAHHYCGKLWIRTGLVLLVIVTAIMLLFLQQPLETLGKLVAYLSLGQCLVIVLTIPIVEKALKKNFDQDGKRR